MERGDAYDPHNDFWFFVRGHLTGGFDLGFERSGMTCAWQVEIDAKCQAVLERHWPNVKRYGDVRDVGRRELEPVDLMCGGFPCQDVSVAGKRKGLAGERSGLWHEFHRVLAELAPGWVVVENVPGLLSSNGGRDFAIILYGLADLGYGVCWRVLDSQYFGIPQRRRRVFIVGYLGDGRAAEVLFEREGGTWDPPPSREKREVIATIAASGAGTSRPAGQRNELDFCVPVAYAPNGKADTQCVAFGVSENQRAELRLTPYSRQLTSGGGKPGQGYPCVAFSNRGIASDVAEPVRADCHGALPMVAQFGVRRLTPTECERLQSFPDGWTAGQSDTARYKQCGNAVTKSVSEWIGRRILEVEAVR